MLTRFQAAEKNELQPYVQWATYQSYFPTPDDRMIFIDAHHHQFYIAPLTLPT